MGKVRAKATRGTKGRRSAGSESATSGDPSDSDNFPLPSGRRGRDSYLNLPVKIRQVWTQRGVPVFSITISGDTLDRMGWEPGMYLQPYMTTGKELVLVEMGQVLKHLSPDYDLDACAHPLLRRRAPRTGSIRERGEKIAEQYEEMIETASGKNDSAVDVSSKEMQRLARVLAGGEVEERHAGRGRGRR